MACLHRLQILAPEGDRVSGLRSRWCVRTVSGEDLCVTFVSAAHKNEPGQPCWRPPSPLWGGCRRSRGAGVETQGSALHPSAKRHHPHPVLRTTLPTKGRASRRAVLALLDSPPYSAMRYL